MCVILVKPDNVARGDITRETLHNCWSANPHGAGIMFSYRRQMTVWKGLMTFEKFLEAWNMVPQRSVAVAHFRIATHGGRDEANTHPFWVISGGLAMVHNGILPIRAREADGLSDTATFVEDVLKKLPDGWVTNAATIHLIDGYIGQSNKIVFLTATGRVIFLNEAAGVWDGGCWYSNHSFRRVTYFVQSAPSITTPGRSLRERWGAKAKVKKSEANAAAAKSIITAARNKHDSDEEVAKELGISLEELRELVLGAEDEQAIRALEVKLENDNREMRQD